MDEKSLLQGLAEELITEWDIIPTGSGFLVVTDWHWPNGDRIELSVRSVGEREDLYLVTDGGDLFNFLFSQGIDLSKDEHGSKVLQRVADNYGARIIDYQIAKGANEGDVHKAVRLVLEAMKDAAFLLWYKLEARGSIH